MTRMPPCLASSRSGRSTRSMRRGPRPGRSCARRERIETSTTKQSSAFHADLRYALCVHAKPYATILHEASSEKATVKTTSATSSVRAVSDVGSRRGASIASATDDATI
eukprot:7143634-Prymnesium_polylepis.1